MFEWGFPFLFQFPSFKRPVRNPVNHPNTCQVAHEFIRSMFCSTRLSPTQLYPPSSELTCYWSTQSAILLQLHQRARYKVHSILLRLLQQQQHPIEGWSIVISTSGARYCCSVDLICLFRGENYFLQKKGTKSCAEITTHPLLLQPFRTVLLPSCHKNDGTMHFQCRYSSYRVRVT